MLKHRLITGFSVAGFFLGAFAIVPYWVLLLLLMVVYVFAQIEYREMTAAGGFTIDGWGIVVCGLVYLVVTALQTEVMHVKHPELSLAKTTLPWAEMILCVTPALLLAREVLRRRPQGAIVRFGLGLVGFWYVAVLLSFMLRIGFAWSAPAGEATDYTGRMVLAYFVWVVKLGDTGAFAFGMGFGQHGGRKLIPEISPAKSVVGLGGAYFGAIAGSLVVALAARFFGDGKLGLMPLSLWHAVGIGALMATVGVLGDLGESLFKRSLGVKDSSRRVPGMGGILDVLDSLLFSAPFMYLYILWFLK